MYPAPFVNPLKIRNVAWPGRTKTSSAKPSKTGGDSGLQPAPFASVEEKFFGRKWRF
jgi:hypothetical protein